MSNRIKKLSKTLKNSFKIKVLIALARGHGLKFIFSLVFYRWWKTTISPSLNGSGRGRARKQRYLMIGILVLFGFVTLLAIFHYFGRSGDENDFHGDPMLDPMSNPNIRVGDH